MSEQQQTDEVTLATSGISPIYTNFCRVTATPEEVILDFGLNPEPFATGKREVKADHRIVMNFFTAKRILMALGMTVERHEGAFGTIELDVNRRVSGRPPSMPQAGPSMQPGQPEVIKLDR